MRQNGEERQREEREGTMRQNEEEQRDMPIEQAAQESEPDTSEQRGLLADAERKAQEYLDMLQRTQADFMNYRRRVSQGQEELRTSAQSELLNQLLPVLDDFAKALETMPEEESRNPWIQGLSLVARRFATALDQSGVRSLGAPGETFDPHWHEAVERETHADVPEGTILQVVRPGYALKERVIRPAQVVVATSPTPASSTSGN